MKGLIIKDILNIKGDVKRLLMALILFGFIGFQSRNPMYITSMSIIMCGILIITSIARDDMAKWDVYGLTMPVTRSQIVLSKYLLLLLLTLIPYIITFIISYLFIVPSSNMEIKEYIISSIAVYAMLLSMICITLPFIYKYGVEKSRLTIFIIMAIPTLLVVLLDKIGIKIPTENQIISMLKIAPVISIFIYLASLKISTIIYINKEF